MLGSGSRDVRPGSRPASARPKNTPRSIAKKILNQETTVLNPWRDRVLGHGLDYDERGLWVNIRNVLSGRVLGFRVACKAIPRPTGGSAERWMRRSGLGLRCRPRISTCEAMTRYNSLRSSSEFDWELSLELGLGLGAGTRRCRPRLFLWSCERSSCISLFVHLVDNSRTVPLTHLVHL
jgi:hypothetical protein